MGLNDLRWREQGDGKAFCSFDVNDVRVSMFLLHQVEGWYVKILRDGQPVIAEFISSEPDILELPYPYELACVLLNLEEVM